MCPCASRSVCVRADDLGQEAGEDADGAGKGPRLWEPSLYRLSVPIRRAIGLTGYFICVYLSVCLYLALSSDVSAIRCPLSWS